MKKFFLFFLLFCFTTILFAYTGTTIGPNVSSLDGKNLQWESGSFDYFVMFKSLMENKIRTPCAGADQNNSVGCDLDGNPEADSCLSESSDRKSVV